MAGKDIILAVIAELGVAGAVGRVLEFAGPAVGALSIDDRLAVSNMAVEAGAETGLLPADRVTEAYLEGRTRLASPRPSQKSDADAEVASELRLDLSGLAPLVAKPHSPGFIEPAATIERTQVDQVYIGNCANGTMTDLRQAAQVLRGRTIHANVRAIVVPATRRIYQNALAEGLIDVFLEAGAMVWPPSNLWGLFWWPHGRSRSR